MSRHPVSEHLIYAASIQDQLKVLNKALYQYIEFLTFTRPVRVIYGVKSLCALHVPIFSSNNLLNILYRIKVMLAISC